MSQTVTERLCAAPLLYRDQRVITLSQMDEAHKRPEGTAQRTFNTHKDKLVEGEDYFIIPRGEAAEFWRTSNVRENETRGGDDLILLTESGYMMLAKPLRDPLSWEVQRALVTTYFRFKKQVVAPHPAQQLQVIRLMLDAMDSQQAQITQVEEQVAGLLETQEAATRELLAIERSPETPPEITVRGKLNQLVRAYCRATNAEPRFGGIKKF